MEKAIMVIDDSTSMRQMIGFTLRTAGYGVVEAADGADGLAKLGNGSGVRMIITDLMMPKMDGIEFIRKIRSHPVLRFLPAVVLTNESRKSKKQAGKAAGATGWIVKPFQPEQLLAVVRRVLR